MNKILSAILGATTILFFIVLFFVFDIWPLNTNGPFIKKISPQKEVSTQIQTQISTLSDEERRSRSKSYDEYMQRGKLFEQNEYYTLAVSQFEAAAKLDPTNTEPLVQIGRMYFKNNDFINAKLSFDKALQLKPDNTNIKVYLVRTLLSDKKIDDAVRVINTVENHNQNSKYYQGLISLVQYNFDQGKAYLQESINLGNSDDIKNKANNFLNSFNEFNFNQGSPISYLKTLLGKSFEETGEYQLSIQMLFSVLKEKKDYRDAWIVLGYSYLKIGKYTDAIEALEQAKKLDDKIANTTFYLGLAYYGVNNLQKAAENLELAKQNGYQPVIQIEQKLADIYLELKDYKQAGIHYENVISLNSKDINYFIRPIWLYIEKLNSPEKALQLAQMASNTHPGTAMSYNLLGWANISAGNFPQANTYFKKALMIDPKLSAVYLNYGQLFEKQKDYQNAISYYKKAYELGNGDSISQSAAAHYNSVLNEIKNNQNVNIQTNIFNNKQ